MAVGRGLLATILLVTTLYAVTPPAANAVAKPKVTKVSPKTGSTKGGTTVTITGSGFVKVKKVTVGGIKVTKVKVLSSKKLRFRAPAHAAGKVTITITTAKGKVTKKAAFTYKKAATVITPPGTAPVTAPVTPPANLKSSGPITATSGQTITGLHITSMSGPCVKVAPSATNITISGNEIGPCGSGVDDVGVLVQAKASKVTITKNTIHNVSSGALMAGAYNPLVFSYNTVYNVRGPFPRGQMVQFAGVSGSAGQSKIIGNVSDKQRATITTTYEDHINLYKTYGSAAFPILVACNKIRGSATANDKTTGEDTSNGSGITVGDNNGAWVEIRNNVVVYTPNTGIGIAGGDHMTVANNLIYNRGATAGSMTQEAVTVFPFLGYQPTNVTITGNRGTSRAWKYGSTGQVVNSYWADPSVTAVTLSDNEFTDDSLTDQIWNTNPSCP